jgi:ferredoxin-NADP reductase
LAEVSPRSPGTFTGRLLRRVWLSEGTFECELERPPSFLFQPGQSIRILLAGRERDYSLASGPEEDRLVLCIRRISGGVLSPVLAEAEPGTRFTFSGPHGFFTYQSSARQAVFVATGTGVAPFVSMARAGTRGFLLLQGVRTAGELCYAETLRAAALRHVSCLTGARTAPGAFPGRVTEYLGRHLPPGEYDFYLCGRREMIRDATLLADERFPGSLVFTEIFF